MLRVCYQKLNPSPSQTSAWTNIESIYSFVHTWFPQVSDWAVPQCTNLMNVLICMFKSIIKTQAVKKACIRVALADSEALHLRSISRLERPVASLGEKADETLHINPCMVQLQWKRADILIHQEYVWLYGKTHWYHCGSNLENKQEFILIFGFDQNVVFW